MTFASVSGMICLIFVYVFYFVGEGAPKLDTVTFTKSLLVRRGGEARFNCFFENAVFTEWYFQEKRLVNSTQATK